ncbi:NAD(P)H-binding protein [Streptomyces sp. N2-109]|uniref:NAD(P)H-binding protein n=1 Tax=Streptomyces gossypii TaxID=2883101 RepID=A0ABT2K097_9ACTN|nr:NAD(P)H-binding protein [Streptomyces gossypii]MCT2592884.1 NAD(P)H-binding protein [Streptomyces gossypii]
MTILVAGATGNVGRQLVGQLARAGQPVRALTRDPERADLPDGVQPVSGDLTRPDSLRQALDGATALHLLTYSDSTPLETGPEIVKLAVEAGVRRATVLWGGMKGPVEHAVMAADWEWTILEPVEFMSNALEWVNSVREEGVIREAFPEVLSAAVHEADIAAVAATALVEGGHGGKSYNLTGPEALTMYDKARIISAATGHDIELVQLTREQANQRLRDRDVPEDVIDYVVGWHANPPASAYTVDPTVEQITGRPARTYAEWVAEHADAFRLPGVGE